MKKTLAILAATVLCQTAFAQGIEAGEAYAYPTLQGMKQGGIFVSLKNTDATDNKLIGASVEKNIAGKTELHTHINDNGVMRMREVKGGIPLPAGQTQELKRGGYHVMVFDVVKPLQVGDKFPVTLKFQNGKPQTLTVTVREMAHGMAGHGHDHGATPAPHKH
ncbi:copper chaperone PCu(A)C [Kingella kingae]|uniref:copper chaperone PCu(A)C n=1 Tax=Kingella kingae TaxID=504 RepID=UPI00254DAED2|nr:copper chaperone PCu(A)C [Kingella kingae]MDK4529037.1 copper chaperone PCu(A)C [Kingella kingae]MDK4543587.1 copper chaperone PCu(A)C [Kingella kingae]MDK4563171.1 copper chaperone PCu(A)C [Kingella kingae]MDK4603325.1 copper chaperone PCu(A)C [Kingella kingae]MDK4633329.1 copper chaperone PCu(A)C [Kingella kingae]